MKIPFTKMEGLGNDYIYLDGINQKAKIPRLEEFIQKISDRHFGIGSDGVIFILPSKVADVKMQMFNADGTESPMCGNGIRCVGKYCYDHKIVTKAQMTVETLAGIKKLHLEIENEKVKKVTVNMGKAILDAEKIPVKIETKKVSYPEVSIEGKDFVCVSMGNPHAVTFVNKISTEELTKIGQKVENAREIFPERTNVEFVKVLDQNTLEMRVWERGTGETLACGTGACASCVASYLKGLTKNKVTVNLLGGDLEIEIGENLEVWMKGEANTVFQGEIEWREEN